MKTPKERTSGLLRPAYVASVRAICYSIAVCNSSVVATFFISRRASRNGSGRNKNSKAYATQHGMSFEAS